MSQDQTPRADGGRDSGDVRSAWSPEAHNHPSAARVGARRLGVSQTTTHGETIEPPTPIGVVYEMDDVDETENTSPGMMALQAIAGTLCGFAISALVFWIIA